MKKYLVVALLLVLPMIAFAQVRATIFSFEGKVEVKAQGASTWTPATVGANIEAGSTISVGLRSSAVLAMGATRINVRPLTRLTLRELVETQGTVNTDLFLSVGKVGADVRPIDGKTQTFTVQSPVATASVRGTSFDFDGVTLEVVRGEVAMVSPSGASIPVAAGEKSVQDPESPNSPPLPPAVALVQASTVVTDLSAALAPPPPGGVSTIVEIPSIEELIETIETVVEQVEEQSTATVVIVIQ